MYKALAGADYFWVIISMFFGVLSHLSRAARWKMLMEPLDHRPRLSNTFFAVCIGYLANYAFPRLGEVSRCGVLTRYEKIPFTESFGTVIAERIIDMITMLLIFFFTLALSFNEIYGQVEKFILTPLANIFDKLARHSVLLFIVIAVMVAMAAALYLLRKKIQALLSDKVKAILRGFLEGFRSVRKVRRPWLFVFHSLFIWGMYYAMVHIVFYSFGETAHLGVKAALAVLMFGSIGVILTPGGIGFYPWIVGVILLEIFFIPEELGNAFGWVVWTSQFVLILLLGLLSFVLLSVLNKEKDVVEAEPASNS